MRLFSQQNRRSRCACSVVRAGFFSLLELLVVIGIMSVILAMLLPSLSQSRRTGKRSVCVYNLHQLEIAIHSYEIDYGMYPLASPLVKALSDTGYMSKTDAFKCVMDDSEFGDTYSYGYMAGHPTNTKDNDPLVVCGWHQEYGTLAAFGDHSVGRLADRTNRVTFPLTMSRNGEGINPGFVLLGNDPLIVEAADGSMATIEGKKGSYLIAAEYDPYANMGAGEFYFTIGFDTDETSKQEVTSDSDNVISFITRLERGSFKLRTDPTIAETRIWYERKHDHNKLRIKNYTEIEVQHRVSGEVENTYGIDHESGVMEKEFQFYTDHLEVPR